MSPGCPSRGVFCGVPAAYSTLYVASGLWEKWREIMELFDIWGCTSHARRRPEKMLPPLWILASLV